MKKIVFLILDGLGGRPVKEFGNKTALQSAQTVNFDKLAEQGSAGFLKPSYKGRFPTSIEGHLSLFSYDIEKWNVNRGVFEALGAGLKLRENDVALRGNFAAVSKDLKIIDRRAGRIEDTSQLVEALRGIKIKGVKFLLADSISHRAVVVLRGKSLSDKISDGDNYQVGIRPIQIKALDNSKEAVFTAQVLNQFSSKAHQVLKGHPLNEQRIRQGLLPANYLLVREPGMSQVLPSFEQRWGLRSCAIAGGKLYQGIAKALAMDLIKVRGATGRADTDIFAKFKAARQALEKDCQFCYLHIKAVDNFSHDGDCSGKKKFLEKIDQALPLLSGLKNTMLVVTGDHATPCQVKQHTDDVIPFFISEKIPGLGGQTIKNNQLLSLLLKFAKI